MFSYWFSIQMIHPLLKTGHWSPYYYCIVEYYPFQFYYSIVSWTRQWQPTPVLLPGKSHGWRSLVGYSPWGHEESDMTERLHFLVSPSCTGEGNGNPLQCFAWRIPGTGEPGGLPSMGLHRVRRNWSDLAAAAALLIFITLLLLCCVQLCLTLRDPMDYSLPGSSIHGIFQARVLEWGAIAFYSWEILCLKTEI